MQMCCLVVHLTSKEIYHGLRPSAWLPQISLSKSHCRLSVISPKAKGRSCDWESLRDEGKWHHAVRRGPSLSWHWNQNTFKRMKLMYIKKWLPATIYYWYFLYRKTTERKQLILASIYKSFESGEGAFLLAFHETRDWGVCHKEMPLHRAKEASNTWERAPMGSIRSNAPLELVCIDFLHLESCKGGFDCLMTLFQSSDTHLNSTTTRVGN